MGNLWRMTGLAAVLALATATAAQPVHTPDASAQSELQKRDQVNSDLDKAGPDKAGPDKAGPDKGIRDKSDLDRLGDTVENIGSKPFKDLNIIQPVISPDVERIMAAPYALTGLRTCAQFKSSIAKLTAVLGPDVDSVQAREQKQTPAEFALGLGESAAGNIIPFSGIIRRISGAEAKQKYAAAAIYAGSVRRAYLKGSARAKGCKV